MDMRSNSIKFRCTRRGGKTMNNGFLSKSVTHSTVTLIFKWCSTRRYWQYWNNRYWRSSDSRHKECPLCKVSTVSSEGKSSSTFGSSRWNLSLKRIRHYLGNGRLYDVESKGKPLHLRTCRALSEYPTSSVPKTETCLKGKVSPNRYPGEQYWG